jgi:hypothetical protein
MLSGTNSRNILNKATDEDHVKIIRRRNSNSQMKIDRLNPNSLARHENEFGIVNVGLNNSQKT